MRGIKIVLAILLTACLGGCASVIRGSNEQIAFQSDPPDAHLQLSNGLSCTSTPCDLKVPRSDDFTATFAKDGFKAESIRVVSHVSGTGVAAGAGNLLLGGAIGVGVDAYNGANLDHEPNPVVAHLSPVDVAPAAKIAPTARRKKRQTPVS